MEKQQNRARVFIADGSADFRLQCAQYLRRQGVEVVGEAADGREAFARIARAKPNVVISELYLSKLDGAGLIRECKKQLGDSFPAFIMMSSFNAQELFEECCESGASYCMIKPPDFVMLTERVRRLADPPTYRHAHASGRDRSGSTGYENNTSDRRSGAYKGVSVPADGNNNDDKR